MTSVTCFGATGADVAGKTWRSVQRQVRFGAHPRTRRGSLIIRKLLELLDVGGLGSDCASLGNAVEHVSKL
jgi:hypothetical protein